MTMRQYSPSATAERDSAPSVSSWLPPTPPPPVALAPPSAAPRKTSTFIPIRRYVSAGSSEVERIVRTLVR